MGQGSAGPSRRLAEGQRFGLVSRAHVWEGGEGSLRRAKSSERAKSTRSPPVREEVAMLVVNRTTASPRLCGRPRESRPEHRLPLECGRVCPSICVFHLELWLPPRVLKTDRSCSVSYRLVLKNVRESPRVSRQRGSVSGAVTDVPGKQHFVTGVLKRFPLRGRPLCPQGFSSLCTRGLSASGSPGSEAQVVRPGRAGGWVEGAAPRLPRLCGVPPGSPHAG